MQTAYHKISNFKIFFAAVVMIGLGACAGTFPGGSDAINESCFKSTDDMLARLEQLTPQMREDEVFAHLCRKKEGAAKIDRREIRIALMGGDNIAFPSVPGKDEADVIGGLYGYKLNYKSVARKHGFTSPIRIRTDETGFNYFVTLIFWEGRLFEKPILSGGLVNGSSTDTIFDFITPGTIINRAIP